jgi:hypothetical protein
VIKSSEHELTGYSVPAGIVPKERPDATAPIDRPRQDRIRPADPNGKAPAEPVQIMVLLSVGAVVMASR